MQVSRGLYLATENVPFWHVVARVLHASVHPLPIPPFRALHSMSLVELKEICLKHHRIHDNLLQPKPVLREDKVLRPSHSSSVNRGIYHFAFLPGGRHVLIMSVVGRVTCMDIERKVSGYGDSEEGGVVGHVLASHQSKLKPLMWNFCTDGEEVLIAVYGTVHESLGMQELQILRLNLPTDTSADTAKMEMLFTINVRLPYGGIDINSDRVIVIGSAEISSNDVLILLVNIPGKRCVFMDTGIHEGKTCINYDAFLVPDGSFILFSEGGTDAMVHIYNDIQAILDRHAQPVEAFRWHNARLSIPPDGTRRLDFAESCHIKDQHRWYTVHPWNTPNVLTKGLIPIFTTSEYNTEHGEEDGGTTKQRTVTHMWLDPLALATYMRKNETSTTPLVLRRVTFNIDLPISRSLDGQELIVPGYCGTHFVWIAPTQEGEDTGKMWLRTLPLATAPESMERVQDPVILSTDVDLSEVDALDLCEEMGIIALARREDLENEDRTRNVRLLYY
ncbi:hypothetical protein FRB95_004458 [Tulasnella sp. JGI-2019a]|nr:hypothetical protein FRB95_004458 [Tulasnella sp. JGI-2019a]